MSMNLIRIFKKSYNLKIQSEIYKKKNIIDNIS